MTERPQERTNRAGDWGTAKVPEKPVRRRFDAAYKQRILDEADRCGQPGKLRRLLRRESLYSSLLSTCRRQREEGVRADNHYRWKYLYELDSNDCRS